MNKQQKQIFDLAMKLPDKSSSLRLLNAYMDQFLINWSYETATVDQHLQALIAFDKLLTKFRIIRGR